MMIGWTWKCEDRLAHGASGYNGKELVSPQWDFFEFWWGSLWSPLFCTRSYVTNIRVLPYQGAQHPQESLIRKEPVLFEVG
jgi:hypothetical protein